jgi:malonate transporter and related proteins
LTALLDVIIPVFLVIGFGYAMARAQLIAAEGVDGIMKFAQNFALPCLLFRSVATLDLSAAYDPSLMFSFYIGAFAGFAAGFLGARYLFNRPLTDAVAIGFACLFSNSLLLGVAITERAYGPDALAGNFAIISIHSPLLYGAGITMMELARSKGQGLAKAQLLKQVARAIFSQPLVIGILCGFAVNLSGQTLPPFIMVAVDMMARAAIPAALFGLGGVLIRYKPEGDRATIAMICAASLILHPAVTYLLARFGFGIDTAGLRSATLTAAMAPGVNAYMFASLYGVAMRVNASAVLVATALSIFTIWGWLQILP